MANTEASSISCIHHWVIAPAAGHTSLGECVKCGEVREFFNSLVFSDDFSTFSKRLHKPYSLKELLSKDFDREEDFSDN